MIITIIISSAMTARLGAERCLAGDPLSPLVDFGGVVIGWDPRRVYRQFLITEEEITRFFNEVGFAAWNLELDRGRPWAKAVSDLSAKFPHRKELIRAYDEQWEESITGTIEGTVRIIERLRTGGFDLIGLTNWSADKFRITRPRYDVFELFHEIIVSGEVGLIKPDREIFDLTLEKASRRPEECVFIDDSKTNVDVAASMGFVAIHFQSPEQLEGELKELGVL